MPALVPENLRHHDILCAMATPSVNGRSSQVVHLAERAGWLIFGIALAPV